MACRYVCVYVCQSYFQAFLSLMSLPVAYEYVLTPF